jgi:lipopolysaccharide cholinephosphotransferase
MERLTPDELRRVQVDILRTIDQFCREQGITYYLAFGTLLGAVRHGGYIPWDDDIDLMMLRTDYVTFIETFPGTPSAEGLSLGAPETRDDWPFPYAKVSDDRTQMQEESDVAVPLGVNVDVFPVDGCPQRSTMRRLQRVELSVFRSLLTLKSLTPRPGRAWHRRLVTLLTKPLTRLVTTRWLVERFTNSARRYRTDVSDHVGVRIGSFDWSVPRAALATPVAVEFEGGSYLAPHDTHLVLTTLYGDYMALPPEAERVSHHRFVARWRQAP